MASPPSPHHLSPLSLTAATPRRPPSPPPHRPPPTPPQDPYAALLAKLGTPALQEQLTDIHAQAQAVEAEERLLSIPFTTIFEYLALLRLCCAG